jgi:nicotinamidase-related amidase
MQQAADLPIALIVVDVQKGLDDTDYWGPRNNPDCERNISALIDTWRTCSQPVVFVRHDSTEATSPLRPDAPGNAFKPCITGSPDLLVTKTVNSAFYGEPSLHEWLGECGIRDIAICGITTNHCCETTARMGGNLGYRVYFIIDATHTFDRVAIDGASIPADDIARVTGANLEGEFADVISTQRGMALLRMNTQRS